MLKKELIIALTIFALAVPQISIGAAAEKAVTKKGKPEKTFTLSQEALENELTGNKKKVMQHAALLFATNKKILTELKTQSDIAQCCLLEIGPNAHDIETLTALKKSYPELQQEQAKLLHNFHCYATCYLEVKEELKKKKALDETARKQAVSSKPARRQAELGETAKKQQNLLELDDEKYRLHG